MFAHMHACTHMHRHAHVPHAPCVNPHAHIHEHLSTNSHPHPYSHRHPPHAHAPEHAPTHTRARARTHACMHTLCAYSATGEGAAEDRGCFRKILPRPGKDFDVGWPARAACRATDPIHPTPATNARTHARAHMHLCRCVHVHAGTHARERSMHANMCTRHACRSTYMC